MPQLCQSSADPFRRHGPHGLAAEVPRQRSGVDHRPDGDLALLVPAQGGRLQGGHAPAVPGVQDATLDACAASGERARVTSEREPGSVYQRKDGTWCARLRSASGKRGSVPLPGVDDEEQAKREAEHLARVLRERERAAALPSAVQGETVTAWAERWFAEREARGMPSVEADRPRWSKWVAPQIGKLAMVAVQKADIERLVEHLDARVAAGAISWKTALNAWTLVGKAFDDACNGKVRALRVRSDNPAKDVRGPDRGGHRQKTALFPDELLRLLRCASVDIDLRRAVAIGVYLGARLGELRALRWQDVDLEHGTVLLHEQVDRAGARRDTKTRRPRRVPIEPELLPLLRAMHLEVGGEGPVVRCRLPKDVPRFFRAALQKAGVDRPELFVDGKDRSRVAVRAHDWRGTFATWCAARGDSLMSIAARCGHTTLSTTQGYVAAGELLRPALRAGPGVFPPLPAEVLRLLDTPGHAVDMRRRKPAKSQVGRQGLETGPCVAVLP